MFLSQLIYFHNAIDFPDEPKAGEESDCSGQQEEQENHNKSVAKV